MPQITDPGVYVEELTKHDHIEGVATSIAAFVGWSPEGPTHNVDIISNWQTYETIFGGLSPQSLLSYAVYYFFKNGGKQAHIVRLAGNTILMPNTPDFEAALIPSTGSGGIYVLDEIDVFNLLCVPGETKPSVVAALQKFCHDRCAFLIVDCDRAATTTSLSQGPDPTLVGENACNSAFYFPWVSVPDPLQRNRAVQMPPCGFVAGVYARTDATQGVWKTPAGSGANLVGASGVTIPLGDDINGILNTRAINCIRTFPVNRTLLWGARTLHGNDSLASEWKYISVRRTALFIEESLYRGLTWVLFEPNDESLWERIRLQVSSFMTTLWQAGAFQGKTPADGYFVKCDSGTTTRNDIAQGIVNIIVGFAPLKPAEFVILKMRQPAGKTV